MSEPTFQGKRVCVYRDFFAGDLLTLRVYHVAPSKGLEWDAEIGEAVTFDDEDLEQQLAVVTVINSREPREVAEILEAAAAHIRNRAE